MALCLPIIEACAALCNRHAIWIKHAVVVRDSHGQVGAATDLQVRSNALHDAPVVEEGVLVPLLEELMPVAHVHTMALGEGIDVVMCDDIVPPEVTLEAIASVDQEVVMVHKVLARIVVVDCLLGIVVRNNEIVVDLRDTGRDRRRDSISHGRDVGLPSPRVKRPVISGLPARVEEEVIGEMVAMKMLLAFAAVTSVQAALRAGQDPCTGCDNSLAQAYQTCAMHHGNPCAETTNGLVIGGPGTKKDISCCMKKEKHDRCLTCKSMDCAYKTCHVNKNYYSEYSSVMDAKTKTRDAYQKYDAKAMKAAGWGF